MPGARGGSNWGSTGSNPEKGMVYVMTQDWPSFYKLSEAPPWAGRGGAGRGGAGRGGAAVGLFERTCQSCHGPGGAGTTVAAPLRGINARMSLADFRRVVTQGKSEMPAFANLDEMALSGLYLYLSSPGRGGMQRPVPAFARGRGGCQLP